MTLEVATSIGVFLFFWVETTILGQALSNQLVLYLSAMLGLIMAAFALYAHVLISLSSRLIVDLVAPGDDTAPDRPRFGPVDALEREGDFEGALGEYLVLARIYPRNVEVLSRTANAHEELERPAEAAEWYLRARKRAKRADDALEVVNQLCRLYDNELDTPDKADYQLAQFIRDFPESPDIDIVRDRLSRRAQKSDWSVSDFLDALEDDPLTSTGSPANLEDVLTVGPPLSPVSQPVELVALDEVGAAEERPVDVDVPPQKNEEKPVVSSGILMPQSDSWSDIESDKPKPKSKKKQKANPGVRNGSGSKGKSALESLDEVKSYDKVESEDPPERRKANSISLESMDDSAF